jgi:iron complex outermembrane receptor protein
MTAYGIENELTWQVTDGFVVRLPASFQHCEYGSFLTLNPSGAGVINLSGLPVNRCPDVTATLDLNYTLPFDFAGGHVTVDLNDNYVAKNLDTYSIAAPYSPFTQTYADARALLGTAITYTGAENRWFARVYGRNLTNKHYKESGQNVDPLWVWAFYGEPLFVGGEVGFKFGQK